MHRVDFKAMKAQVGIDDIAYHLGYRIDKAAGLGKHIEMVLSDGGKAVDKIIIKNPHDKANQTYFRRNGQRGGDVITFIQDNLTALGESGKNQWEAVVNVLANFSSTYIEQSRQYLDTINYKGVQVFDPNRYDTKSIMTDSNLAERFFATRGIQSSTVAAFSEKIVLIKDLHNTTYDTYNIGFPYTRPNSEDIVGYEVRGYKGYKSKAAGTDSTNAAWIVDLSIDKAANNKQYVFFAESALDLMAFYQANRTVLNTSDSVFVSIGGTFSDKQIKAIMQHYKNAKAVDCFDNDLVGKLYGVRMLGILSDTQLGIARMEDTVTIKVGDKEHSFVEHELTPARVAREFGLTNKVEIWKSPKQFKDWNDAIISRPITTTSKYEQGVRLAHQRQLKR